MSLLFLVVAALGKITRRLGISLVCAAAAKYGIEVVWPLASNYFPSRQRPPRPTYQIPLVEVPPPPVPLEEVLYGTR